jgi:hypothetical protein
MHAVSAKNEVAMKNHFIALGFGVMEISDVRPKPLLGLA